MESNLTLKTLVDRIEKIGLSVSNDGASSPEVRQELRDVTKQLSFALENPFETMQRLVFVVSLPSSAMFRVD